MGTANEERVAWTVRDWAKAVSLSRPYVHILISKHIIRSVKAGTRRLITTAPQEYLAQLDKQQTSYTPRGRPRRNPTQGTLQ